MLDSYRRSKAQNFPVGSQLILEGKSLAVLSSADSMFKGVIIGNAGFQTSASLLPWGPQLLQVHAEMQQYWPLSVLICFLILPCDKKLTIESKHLVPSTQIGYRHLEKDRAEKCIGRNHCIIDESYHIHQHTFCSLHSALLMRGHCCAWQTSETFDRWVNMRWWPQ